MKKIFFVILGTLCVGACASAPQVSFCNSRDLQQPSFFAHGESLAAFKVTASARGYGLDGVLQIKKLDTDSYDVTLFAAVGGYRLMRAVVTPEGTAYSFLAKEADTAVARSKAETFLRVLLFPPSVLKKCKERKGILTVTYKENATARYEYVVGSVYPRSLAYKKIFGAVRLNFGEYTPYEEGELPHYLYYQDGVVEGELILLTLKK